MHCFTETWDVARAALDLGFHISMSGIVTFKNAQELKDVARRVPLDRLLIETDSPYLAPVPFRGKRNQPAYVAHVAAEIARLRDVPLEDDRGGDQRQFLPPVRDRARNPSPMRTDRHCMAAFAIAALVAVLQFVVAPAARAQQIARGLLHRRRQRSRRGREGAAGARHRSRQRRQERRSGARDRRPRRQHGDAGRPARDARERQRAEPVSATPR